MPLDASLFSAPQLTPVLAPVAALPFGPYKVFPLSRL